MVEWNRLADTAAGEAAHEHRLPQEVRTRIAKAEYTAMLVRKRLLRAHVDAVAADPRPQEDRRKKHHKPPPAPKI
eukprot:1509011-Pyramimonas_sp.AAC.1